MQQPNVKNIKIGDLLKSITIDTNNLLDPKCQRLFMTLLSVINQDHSLFRSIILNSEIVNQENSILFRVSIQDKIYFYTNSGVTKVEDLLDKVYEYIISKTITLEKLVGIEIPLVE